ncbi:hypothetical protein EUX98_g3252 [Antrodiella citrinella]|uniref:DNA topoisomerase (ATP-hydrolyzing) n=1 Tax=Antrodiella citrinella TaxID=2447956 RepID=A0A4S4MZ45_9APHY|nr:hypothetical protein EUX98_g3252 [Antrodiella citrinella]
MQVLDFDDDSGYSDDLFVDSDETLFDFIGTPAKWSVDPVKLEELSSPILSGEADKLMIFGGRDDEDEDAGEINDEMNGDQMEEDDPKSIAMQHIEDMTLDFLSQLSEAIECAGPESTKNVQSISLRLADRTKLTGPDGSFGTRTLTYPRKAQNSSSCKPFAQLFRVMDLMHEALSDDTPTTKRDMYYKDVALFKQQSVVDKLVDDIAASAGNYSLTAYTQLLQRASAKGLFCGSALVVHLRSGGTLYGADSEGTLIPASDEIERFEVNEELRWVLVVEKEAVFQTLAHMQITRFGDFNGPGIVITGKGYPDVATRQLVCTLAENLPDSVPILALVDADPYGIDILSVYKYGSVAMSHEYESLAAPRIKWIGVFSSELASLSIDKDDMIPITKRDEQKALSMLRRTLPKKWRRELQHMIFTRRKAEIEILSRAIYQNETMIPVEDGSAPQTCSENRLVNFVHRKICVANKA